MTIASAATSHRSQLTAVVEDGIPRERGHLTIQLPARSNWRARSQSRLGPCESGIGLTCATRHSRAPAIDARMQREFLRRRSAVDTSGFGRPCGRNPDRCRRRMNQSHRAPCALPRAAKKNSYSPGENTATSTGGGEGGDEAPCASATLTHQSCGRARIGARAVDRIDDPDQDPWPNEPSHRRFFRQPAHNPASPIAPAFNDH